MHGVWFLTAVPLAAIVAWRTPGIMVKRLGFWIAILASVAIVAWFALLMVQGAKDANSIADRFTHSFGVMFAAIDIPLLQILLAAIVMCAWPAAWKFRQETGAS